MSGNIRQSMTIQTLSFKIERDIILVNILSALLIAIIAFFPDSPVRIILGLPFILFFPGYMLICALFPRKEDLGLVERLALSMGLSMAVTSLIGLTLNYTPFGIRLYPITFSLFLFILLMSAVAMYRRRIISPGDAFAPLSQKSISGCFERVKNEFIKSDAENRIIKIIAIIAFILITLALTIIAKTPPVSGYELTIYDAYPSYFWYFICISISGGILILMHQAFAEQKSNWWLMGLCIVIFSNAIFLGLPFFRGYAIYPLGDALSHLGWMKDIITTGHIGKYNFYPIVHLLGVSILEITELSRGAVTNLLFVFWSIMYLLNTYLLGTMVANRRGQALLITAFACPLVFSALHTVIHPSLLSLFMIPLMLYFYHRREKLQSGKIEGTIVLILLAFAITYTHPVTCLFAIALFLAFIPSGILYKQIATRKQFALQRTINIGRNYNIPLIMFIVFFMWYFSYAAIQGSFRRVHEFLVYSSGVSLFEDQTRQLTEAELSALQTIELFIYSFGAIVLYLLISVIAVIIVLKWSLSKKAELESMDYTYAIQFIVALLVSAFSLFAFTGEFSPIRVSRFFLLMAPIISGLVIYRFIDNTDKASQQTLNTNRLRRKRGMFICITTVLILTVVILSIFNVYGSPRVVRLNWQVSAMQVVGAEWFSNYHDNDVVTATAGVVVSRFEDLTFGREYPSTDRAKLDREPIPSHFGYDGNGSVAETFDFGDRYLLTCEMGRVSINAAPESARPMARQYTEDDFAKLMADPAVAQIYANGEFEVWRVYRGEE